MSNEQPMVDKTSPEFIAAVAQAGDELGLPDYYRSCIRPLMTLPKQQWPVCCGGGCDPCAQTLTAVAERACQLLGLDPHLLHGFSSK